MAAASQVPSMVLSWSTAGSVRQDAMTAEASTPATAILRESMCCISVGLPGSHCAKPDAAGGSVAFGEVTNSFDGKWVCGGIGEQDVTVSPAIHADDQVLTRADQFVPARPGQMFQEVSCAHRKVVTGRDACPFREPS